MKLEGAQIIAADRMTVWNAINDPEILKRCISGCEAMTRVSPTRYEAVVKQKIGPVSATFEGDIQLSDVVEGESLRLAGAGKGGVAGMAKGGALVTLSDAEDGTRLAYEAEGSVAGKLAQLGSRLIDGVAQKMAASFFSKFKEQVEGGSGDRATDSGGAGVHDTGAGGVAMAAAAGAVGVAGEVASAGAASSAQGARADADAHTGALHDAAAERMLNPAIGAGAGEIDMDDPDIGDIDVSSVDGGPSEAEAGAAAMAARATGSQDGGEATVDVADNLSSMDGSFDPEGGAIRDHVGAVAAPSGAAASTTMPPAGQPEGAATGAPEIPVTDPGDARISGAGAAASAAAVGGIGAAVSGFAARAQDTFDETHEKVRERVIAAGGDVDEAKSWNDTKEHLSRAASETRDTAQDVYDAARARISGDKDRAEAEWNDARTNASEAYAEVKGGAEDAWTTGKGYAAEEAKAPRIGPLGQPWYLWIIGVIVLLVILWIVF